MLFNIPSAGFETSISVSHGAVDAINVVDATIRYETKEGLAYACYLRQLSNATLIR